MIKTLLIFSSLLICNLIKTQVNSPLNFDQGVWINTEEGPESRITYQYFCKGDTLLNSLKYYKLFQYSISNPVIGPIDTFPVNYKGAIRFTNKNQMLFIYKNDTLNRLLYDFNLKIGDTIINGFQGKYYNPTVKKIDSFLICGKFYKRFKTQYTNIKADTTALIEGIGMNQCLFGVLDISGQGEATSYGCYSENNNQYCAKCNILLNIVDNSDFYKDFEIFPNPGNSVIIISSSKGIKNISISNLNGQLIYFKTIFNSKIYNININSFLTGTYFIKLEYYDKSTKIKPFIKN